MAITFNGTNQYSYVNAGASHVMPCSFGCWFMITDVSATGRIMGIYSNDEALNNTLNLQFWGTPDNVLMYQTTAGAAEYVQVAVTLSANTWYHALAVFASTTSRSCYINGANKTTNTNSLAAPNNLASGEVIFGAQYADATNTYTEYLPVKIAEAAFWPGIALTDQEAASLGAGASPLMIRPGVLMNHWPFGGPRHVSRTKDTVSSYNLTELNSPTDADHPKIIYPTSPQFVRQSPAVVGATRHDLCLLGVGT